MTRATTSPLALASKTETSAAVECAWDAVGESFEQFCLVAGLASLTQLLDEDARALAGEPHAREPEKPGYRWGRTKGRLGFHGGKVALLGILPNGAGINWDKVIFKGLVLHGIYGRRMYETWYKMTQMILTGFPLGKVLTHQVHIDDFQKGFDLMDAGNCGKVVCSWN